MRLNLIFLFTFMIVNSISAQKTIIQGEILDYETEKSLPAAHINIFGSNYGTITNVDGEFQLLVESLPIKLIISYTGFYTNEVLVNSNKDFLRIKLQPLTVFSDEIVVRDDYEIRILEGAIEQLLSVEDRYFGRGFYRQTSRVDTIYTEFIETFYDAEISTNKVEDWRVKAGRYAVVPPDSVYFPLKFNNYSIFSRLPVIQSYSYQGNATWPIRKDAGEFYNFFLKERYNSSTDSLFVIKVEPKSSGHESLYEGTVTISQTDQEYFIRELNLFRTRIKISIKGGKTKNSRQSIYVKMAEVDESTYIPGIIKTNFEFDYVTKKGIWPFRRIDNVTEISTSSTLFFYEYNVIDNNFPFAEEYDTTQNDYMLIDQADYNPEFWRSNPIIRRTTVEESIIESFERYGSFGKMFNEDL